MSKALEAAIEAIDRGLQDRVSVRDLDDKQVRDLLNAISRKKEAQQ